MCSLLEDNPLAELLRKRLLPAKCHHTYILISVSCIRCYVCSTLTDPKCGVSWELQGAEAENRSVFCGVNGGKFATACWKYVQMNTSKFLVWYF